MANNKTSKVIQQLRRAALLRDGAGMTDGQLLDCFLSQRDDAAFAAIVRRHGPMVWGVCRRVLHHHQDAEDAFQATFLVLVRKAATVEPKEMVANWLYGVAYQTALKARSVAARRKERQVVEMPELAVEEREAWHDLQPLLDQELSRLPDKYRIPIVLCDLEGKTRKEAARQLGWPEGTVAGRLAMARKMLARRLVRRGVALSGGTLAAVLSHNAASACMPPSVVSTTIQAATMLATGQAATTGLISVKVAALTEGVLKTMQLTTLKTVTAVLLAVGILAAGRVIYRTQTTGRADAQGERFALAMAGEENKPAAPNKIDAGKGQQKVIEKDEVIEKARKWVQKKAREAGDPDPLPGVIEKARKWLEKKAQQGEQNAITIHALLEETDAKGNTINAIDVGNDALPVLLMGMQQKLTSKEKTAASELAESLMRRRTKLLNLPLANDAKMMIDGKEARVSDLKAEKLVTLQLTAGQRGLEVVGVQEWGKRGQCADPSPAGQKTEKAITPAQRKQPKAARMWQVRATLEGHSAAVNQVAFSRDGKFLASASDDSTVKVWDLATSKERVTLTEPDGGGIRGVAFAPDGKTIATAGGDKAVRLWDAVNGTPLQVFTGHSAATYSVVFTPDGKTLVSGGGCANYPDKGQMGYGEIRLWDPSTGKLRAAVQSHTWPVAHLAFMPDGKILISGGYDNSFKLWDWDVQQQPKERLAIEAGQGQGLYSMALSPDGLTLAVTCDGTVKTYEATTGKGREALEKSAYRDGWLWGPVAFSPDGKTIAAASPIQEWEDKDKKFVVQRRSDIMLWDAATGKFCAKLPVDECVTALAFSPDGTTLVTGCRGKMRQPEQIRQLADLETEQRGVVKVWTWTTKLTDKSK